SRARPGTARRARDSAQCARIIDDRVHRSDARRWNDDRESGTHSRAAQRDQVAGGGGAAALAITVLLLHSKWAGDHYEKAVSADLVYRGHSATEDSGAPDD